MRYIITLAFCFLLVFPQVHACPGPVMEESLFFKTIPESEPEADLIAIVSVLDDTVVMRRRTHTAMVTVIQIIKSSDPRVKQGDTIPMWYPESSCGPSAESGKKGTIIAKTSTDRRGHVVLHPYTHSSRSLSPPVKPPVWYDVSARSLHIGHSVPEDSAVILIGVVGTESLDGVGINDGKELWISMFPELPAPPKGILAIAVPIGLGRQLSISMVVAGRVRAGYRGDDVVQVDTPKLDIDRPGIYYIATFDTNNPRQFQTLPIPEQIKQFRVDYASTVAGLEPINFKWPGQ